MADDFDVEAMLEAPYRKEDDVKPDGRTDKERRRRKSRSSSHSRSPSPVKHKRKRSRSRERSRSKSRDRRRSPDRRSRRDREKKRSRSRDRRRSRDRERKRGSRSRSRDRRSRSKERYGGKRSRSRSPHKNRRGEKPHRRSPSPMRSYEFVREPGPELSPEERDARTIFCMQLSARIRPRDLEEFFSSIGKVRDVRLITDNKTRRSKGIAYVEFVDVECVNKALALTGQRLLGVPIMVQPSQAEKNRAANATATLQKGNSGPMRLYVGSLHFNITEEMLRGIFEPFGKIDDIKLIKDHESGRLQGYGFITFHDSEDAKKALEQLNGFELAGRPMKVGHVTERTAENQVVSILDSDEMDRAGIDLGATGRLQLMAKLAEGTGFQIPQYAANALNINSSTEASTPPPPPPPPPAPPVTNSPTTPTPVNAAAAAAVAAVTASLIAPPNSTVGTGPPAPQQAANGPPIPTQCFMLANMFDPSSESKVNWDQEIRDDVIEECNKHGGVVHIYVDKAAAQGNVYVKCPNIAAAVASVNALHGRYFAGKLITAAYVPLPNYHTLFPGAVRANQLLLPSTQALQYSYGAALFPGMPPNIAR